MDKKSLYFKFKMYFELQFLEYVAPSEILESLNQSFSGYFTFRKKEVHQEYQTINIYDDCYKNDYNLKKITGEFASCKTGKSYERFLNEYGLLFNKDWLKENNPDTSNWPERTPKNLIDASNFLLHLINLCTEMFNEKINYSRLLDAIVQLTDLYIKIADVFETHPIGKALHENDDVVWDIEKVVAGNADFFNQIYDRYQEKMVKIEDYLGFSPGGFMDSVLALYTDTRKVSIENSEIVDFYVHLQTKYKYFVLSIEEKEMVNEQFDEKEKKWIKNITKKIFEYYIQQAYSKVKKIIQIDDNFHIIETEYIPDLFYAMMLNIMLQDPQKYELRKCEWCGKLFPVTRNNKSKKFCERKHAQNKANNMKYIEE